MEEAAGPIRIVIAGSIGAEIEGEMGRYTHLTCGCREERGPAASLFSNESGHDQHGKNPFYTMITGVESALATPSDVGAQSQIRAAIDPALSGGEFIGPAWLFRGRAKLEKPAANMRDRNSAKILWTESEERTVHPDPDDAQGAHRQSAETADLP